jgi:cytochrome c biogenesis protein CcmG, thiol:disulfide interchange protein DsbE
VRRALWLLPVVVLFVVGGVALFRARPEAALGKAAPGFALPDLARPSERIALDRFKGTPVVINFWASWCEPCRDEAPELARTARKLGRTVTFLGVNILDGRDEALAYVKKYKIPYPSVRDARGIIAKRYEVTGAPETVFIDRDGNVVGKYIGAFERGQLERYVRVLSRLRANELLDITGRGETRPVP